MLRWLTAGESHGPALVAVLEGLPAGVPVTSSDIADAVKAQLGVEVDRRDITLDEPLKELGVAEVPIRLHTDVTATLHVEVYSS